MLCDDDDDDDDEEEEDGMVGNGMSTMSLPRFGHGRGGNITLIDPLSLNGSVWDPFEGVSVVDSAPTLRHASPNRNPNGKEGAHARAMASVQIDWRETVSKADLPGLKEEVKVQVVNGTTLDISGDRKEEEGAKVDLYHCMERAHGVFCRRFHLPNYTLPDDVKATVADGILTVTIPKLQIPKLFVRQIQVS